LIGILLGASLMTLFFLSYHPNITGSAIAPSDTISEKDISVFADRVIINVHNATVSRYEGTGSMMPFIGTDANGIRVKPQSADEINVGDIISFNSSYGVIVHRVITKGSDVNGVYFITRGDNTYMQDAKIRFNDILYKTVGILY